MVQKFVLLLAAGLMLAFASGANAQEIEGKVLFEYWFDASIGGNLDTLKAFTDFPLSPHEAEYLDSFAADKPNNDNYGGRGRAYLTAPADGDYTFWVFSDDDSELWLSTDEDPANAVQIAGVEGWTGWEEWAKYETQQSAPVTLLAGQRYYIEGIYSDGTGGGNMGVGWAGPEVGEDITLITGDYLTAVAPRWAAGGPDPADGTTDVLMALLQWQAALNAEMYDVYFGETAELGEGDFRGRQAALMYFHVLPLDPGKTYYWRVDAVSEEGNVAEGSVWSFTVMPMEAHAPSPADGAVDIRPGAQLSWTAGQDAVSHEVYFGTDPDALELVASGDATSYDPNGLEGFTTYYWRVDEPGTPGPVWSFTTVSYVPVSLDEVTLEYDNAAEPFTSELALDVPADLTAGGRSADLTMRFQGQPGPEGDVSIDETTGTYEVSGSGADIWGNSDQFHYAYMQLTGNGEISARVADIGTGSNNWAKGGVMIRETLAADSKHMIAALTGSEGGGIAFQGRPITGDRSNSFHGDVTAAAPYWVKLTREGNTITAYHSADGVEWTLFEDASPDGAHTNPIDVEMADPVYIGLFVTSHQSGEVRTFTFDNVNVAGDVTAMDHSDVGIPFNAVEPMYVALEDAAGNVAAVPNPNAEAVRSTEWDFWRVPLSAFEGVDATAAAKLYLGVGDGEAGGSGLVRFNDVRVVPAAVEPAPGAVDVTAPNDVVVSEPDDGDWPDAETPDKCIDDDAGTKFLHFKGGDVPVGVKVTPAAGPSIVTGIVFTTANDTPGRDPAAFEIYGSNESIDGPWTLIAAGEVDDFTRPIEWPRFKKSATPLGFANDVAYAHYQVLITALRDPGAGMMQVAEIELLGETMAFSEDFEAYAAGSDLHGQGGWKGWDNTDTAGAPASDALASSGSNSVEVVGSADLVHEFIAAGGIWEFSVMQYIPSGTTGETFFILLNTYNDGGPYDWSVQLDFNLGAGVVTSQNLGGDLTANIVYDQWVELKLIIDLDSDSVEEYYNGELLSAHEWDDNDNPTLGAIDLFGNGASSIYYDDLTLVPYEEPVTIIASVVRSNGVSGDRDPIGAYDGATTPLATEEGGLMDGAVVFSDRTYPWAGIPAEYVGSEYIRTFNSDKNGGTDPAYEVTTSAAAIVWVTVDDRIPEEWDADGTILSQQDAADAVTAAFADPGTFVDTGVDIFVREAEDGSRDRPMSVFAAELPAGTYVFGRMDSGKNFYTIGAIPAQ